MIRQWVPMDLSAIADIWIAHRNSSQWAKWQDIETPKDDVCKWVLSCMMDYHYTAFVKENEEKDIVACIGACLTEVPHPPHIRQVSEWCMWGESVRDLAELWREVCKWGKGRGAILAQRGTISEHGQLVVWEKL
jgi:hypothetical protein